LSALNHVKELSISNGSLSNFEESVRKAWAHQLKWLKVISFCLLMNGDDISTIF
jgi:hypothetical protein